MKQAKCLLNRLNVDDRCLGAGLMAPVLESTLRVRNELNLLYK